MESWLNAPGQRWLEFVSENHRLCSERYDFTPRKVLDDGMGEVMFYEPIGEPIRLAYPAIQLKRIHLSWSMVRDAGPHHSFLPPVPSRKCTRRLLPRQ
jgi:hypothetical protein